MSGDLVDLPPHAAAAALAGFEAMTLARLVALLRDHPPDEAFAVAAGTAAPRPRSLVARVLGDPVVREAWRRSAAVRHPAAVWEQCLALGIRVSLAGSAHHPEVLAELQPPVPVLFSRGDLTLLTDGAPRVALVGTRNATTRGRLQATRLATDLAAAGVHVLSGLARGIDGAAHAAVVGSDPARGRAIAVVASGLDVVYPPEHRSLWQRVAATGVVISEHPPGAPPTAWRFPQRNRIVAGLADVVVVIESRARGGSLITADLAIERGTPVMAVPGHVDSAASVGTNELLRDGAAPVLDANDVLDALRIGHRLVPAVPGLRRPLRPTDRELIERCLDIPRTLGDLVELTGRSFGEVAVALARLEQQGWIAGADGWFEVAVHERDVVARSADTVFGRGNGRMSG
jgi:DNA processing protein